MIIKNLLDLNLYKNVPGIYLLKNKINNKYYCGETYNLYKRIIEHKKAISNQPIHKSIRKYGFDNFQIKLIEYGEHLKDKNIRLILEEKYIKKFNTLIKNGKGYNLCLYGLNNTGIKHTPETRHKQSIAKKDKKYTKEHCKNISKSRKLLFSKGYVNPMKGKFHNSQSIEKIRLFNLGKHRSKKIKNKISESHKLKYKNGYVNPRKGKKCSLESCNKMSESQKELYKNGYISPRKGKHCSEEHKEKLRKLKMKSIKQLDLEGNLIKVWNSITDAANFLKPFTKCNFVRGIISMISSVCKNKRKSAYSFKWEYV